MKVYVMPVESYCNGKCSFCITRFRNMRDRYLNPASLKRLLDYINPDKIEITGGGEPLLSFDISEIIKICSKKAPTSMYTNGSLPLPPESNCLSALCLSRQHYDDKRNNEIMGVNSDISEIKKELKFR